MHTSVTLHDLSSEELARRAQHGCRASFTELVHRHTPGLQAFLGRRTPEGHEAEDLMQDTFIKAYQNLGRYDDSWRFSTWLFTIAARLAVSRGRQRSRERLAPGIPAYLVASDLTDQQEQRESLWAMAARLPRAQYEALWLKYRQDLPVKEIARTMGKSQVNIKVLLYRARISLARRLREDAGMGETTP